MPKRKSNKRRLYKYAIGDLKDSIKIHTRTLVPTLEGYEENIDEGIDKWSAFESIGEQYMFADVNIEENITHIFVIRFDNRITSENIIRFKNNSFKIMDIENVDLRSEWMKLFVHFEGSASKETNT